ncbi:MULTISPECIES: hypothetical protein [unclassified Dehalobacter]|uniref:hypothetical protein n=1 Tax=unclassified Dehalobacter TaxID=2635733 RepID=UPI000E6C4764|nr:MULTISPECIES: hypothetical protein [unclassified Dehalobacter]RJE49330.1 hypothetical protein A7K50_07410 [Dehalobacter sp. MCB1]TCX53380.1 hypothetical protein C1I36_01080 [Dehalobacter sp. 14DCB1]TCX54394.1 hypothetical protein C1I38_06465 [Dehalobacter sp. 12DCB1]
MKIPIIALILQGIPEQIAVVTLAYVIAGMPFVRKRIISMGIILALTSYLLRVFPILFGLHTVIMLVFLFVLLFFWGKSNFYAALVASLLSFLALIIGETVCLSLLMPLFHVSAEMLNTDVGLRILITLPQVFVLFIVSLIILKIKKMLKGK